jgi:hypothetical protein
MNRLSRLVGATVVAGLVGWSPPALAQTSASRPAPDGQRHAALSLSGSIEGRVVDERGMPLTGAMVSALGSTSAVAVTDQSGAFALRALPVGSYVLRAHMSGFAPSRRQLVEVVVAAAARYSVTLQRSATLPAAPGQASPPPPPPKLIAAGLAPVEVGFDPLAFDPLGARDDPGTTPEDRAEKAWRIRHLPRSVLKTTTERSAAKAPERAGSTASVDAAQPRTAAAIARAMAAPVRLLGDLPLTGQINLMTSGSFDGLPSAWASDSAVRGTAYLTLAGPAWGYGDWSARVVTQADLGAWFMSGAFRNRAPSRHLYNVGFSYSTQRVAPTVSLAHLGLERTELAGRAAGTLYGVGQFVLSPRLSIDYGARYSHYDYLSGAGLFSPSVMVTLVPVDRFRVKAGASRRLLAPGAEEFMEPLTSVLWVPPERTFVGFSPMVPERTFRYEVALEHDLTPALMLSFRSSYQNTRDQQIAFFGGPATGERQRHYGIGDAGDVIARGWSVGVTHHLLSRLHGSVAYEVTDARWLPDEPGTELLLVGYRPRSATERLRDLATSIETVIPVTLTQVYVAYRINTGFARFGASDATGAGLDSRFDVQVTQRLPSFGFTSAQWQVLVAVKNLFRDASKDGSIYDELFVVKPPTRILGGVMVRF